MKVCYTNYNFLTNIKQYLSLEDFRSIFKISKEFNSQFKDYFKINEEFKKLVEKIENHKTSLAVKTEKYNEQKLIISASSNQNPERSRKLSKRKGSFSAIFNSLLPLKNYQNMNDLTSQSNKYCIDDTHLDETEKLEKEINQHERAIEFLYKTKSKQENSHQMTKRVEKFLSQNQKKLVKKERDPYQKKLKIILYDLFEEDDQIYKIIHGSNSNGSLFFAAKYKKNDKELMTLVFQERYTHEQLEFMKCPQELRENNYCWIRTSWNCSQSNYFDKIKEYETIEELEIDLANFNHS